MKGFLLINLVAFTAIAVNSKLLEDPLVKKWLYDQRNPNPDAEETYVTIQNGTVVGTSYNDIVGNNTIYAYLGIPYAQPPVGSLRFKPPQQYNGWEGILDGTVQPPSCAQFLTNVTVAQEDCLFVSVYTRRNVNNTGEPLPVMFWIHGGGFLLGQSSYYGAEKLLAEEAVLVTVQYRLGPLGFLTTGDGPDGLIPPNNGMKDIVQALRWVQENIAAFGGDPNKVTIMGESAGGATSILMLTSPLAQGLFHQVASISGTSLAEWSIERKPLDTLTKVAAFLECDTTNTTTIYNCLIDMQWGLISQAHFYVLLQGFEAGLFAILPGASVVIEGDVPGAFLTDEPLTLLESGPLPQVPVLLGANQHEGSLLLAAAYVLELGLPGVLDDPVYVHDHLIGDLLVTWGADEKKNGASMSQGLSLAFIPPGLDRSNFSQITYEIVDMLSVVFLKAPILRTAEILSRRLPAVYLYSFEYYGKNSLFTTLFALMEELIGDLLPIPTFKGGVTHADDVLYMFTMPLEPSAADVEFSKIWNKFFTDFAATGNPTPEATAQVPLWPAFTINDPNYMTVSLNSTVSKDYSQSWRQGTPTY